MATPRFQERSSRFSMSSHGDSGVPRAWRKIRNAVVAAAVAVSGIVGLSSAAPEAAAADPVPNPSLPSVWKCGKPFNVDIVIDRGSASTVMTPNGKYSDSPGVSALNNLVYQISGANATNAVLRLTGFGGSPDPKISYAYPAAKGGAGANMSVPGQVTAFRQTYDSTVAGGSAWNSSLGTRSWYAGMVSVGTNPSPDLVIFVTDGIPGGNDGAADVNAAQAIADQLKQNGTRVLTVAQTAVADNKGALGATDFTVNTGTWTISSTTEIGYINQISGPTGYTTISGAVDPAMVATADYIQTTGDPSTSPATEQADQLDKVFTAIGEMIRGLVQPSQTCPELRVEKKIEAPGQTATIDPTGTVTGVQEPAGAWAIALTGTGTQNLAAGGTASVQNLVNQDIMGNPATAAVVNTTAGDGSALDYQGHSQFPMYKWADNTAKDAQGNPYPVFNLTLSETPPTGYEFVSASCQLSTYYHRNANGTVDPKLTTPEYVLLADHISSTTGSLKMTDLPQEDFYPGDVITCTFVNRVIPETVTVKKQWEVHYLGDEPGTATLIPDSITFQQTFGLKVSPTITVTPGNTVKAGDRMAAAEPTDGTGRLAKPAVGAGNPAFGVTYSQFVGSDSQPYGFAAGDTVKLGEADWTAGSADPMPGPGADLGTGGCTMTSGKVPMVQRDGTSVPPVALGGFPEQDVVLAPTNGANAWMVTNYIDCPKDATVKLTKAVVDPTLGDKTPGNWSLILTPDGDLDPHHVITLTLNDDGQVTGATSFDDHGNLVRLPVVDGTIKLRPGLSYVLTETPAQAASGYRLASVVCTAPVGTPDPTVSVSGGGDQSDIQAGQTVSVSFAPNAGGPDGTASCVVTNKPVAPKLTLTKDVNAGPLDGSAWDLTATPAPAAAGAVTLTWTGDPRGAAPQGAAQDARPVTYQLDERAITGHDTTAYEPGTWSCKSFDEANPDGVAVAAPDPNAPLATAFDPTTATLRLALGDDVRCEITNQTALVELQKAVINDDGGTAKATDWKVWLEPEPATPTTPTPAFGDLQAVTPLPATGVLPGTDSLAAAGPVAVLPGAKFKVHEAPVDANNPITTGYQPSLRCRVSNGADLLATPAAEAEVVDGARTGWSVLAGDAVVWFGPNAAPDDLVTCQVVNNDIAPELTLVKELNTTASTDAWTLTAAAPGAAVPSIEGKSGEGTVTGVKVTANVDYALTESPTATGAYAPLDGLWTCTGSGIIGDSAGVTSVKLAPGGKATCTITNVTAQVQLAKTVVNEHGGTASPRDWTFRVGPAGVTAATDGTTVVGTMGDPLTIDNVLAANGTSRSGTSQPVWLRPGLGYAVMEQDGPAGYQVSSSIKCVAGDVAALSDPAKADLNTGTGLEIKLSAQTAHDNELITCAVVNTDIPPQLTLVKDVAGANPKAWTLTASADCPAAGDPGHDTCVAQVDVPGDAGTPNEVTAGLEYRLSETLTGNDVTEPFAAHAWVCESDNGGAFFPPDPRDPAKANVVSLTLGAHVTCTLTNVKAALQLQKTVDNGTTGGTAVPSDFTLTLTRTVAGVAETTDLIVVGGDAATPGSTQAIPIRADTYTVTEQPARGYTMTVTGCVVKDGDSSHPIPGVVSQNANGYDTITLPTTLPATSDALPVVVCTVENVAVAPKLTLVKDWPGQPEAAGDVMLKADPNSPTDRGLTVVAGTMRADAAAPADAKVISGRTVMANVPYALTETIDPAAAPSANLGWACVDRNNVDAGGVAASATMGQVGVGDADVPTVVPQVGQDIVCTVTNVTAQVAIQKTVANTHGGAALPSDWSFTLAPVNTDGTLGDPLAPVLKTDPADDPASPEGTNSATTTGTVAVRPGQLYHVIEQGPTGYQSGAVTCRVLNALTPGNVNDVSTDGDILIPIPDNATVAQILSATVVCEITNTDVAPKLTLKKTVYGTDGTDGPENWTLSATAQPPTPAPANLKESFGGTAGSGDVQGQEITANVPYVLAEAATTPGSVADANYVNVPADGSSGQWLCTGVGAPAGPVGVVGESDSAELTLQPGADVTCEIVNATAALTLAKVVTGGTTSPDNWSFTVTAVGRPDPVVGNGQVLAVTSGSTAQLAPLRPGATYQVTETPKTGVALSGYAMTDFSCEMDGQPVDVQSQTEAGVATIVLPTSATGVADVTCTATNEYKAPQVTLAKTVTTNSGGPTTASPGDWRLALNPPNSVAGDPETVWFPIGSAGQSPAAPVVPGVAYTVTEWANDTATPPTPVHGYLLKLVGCTLDGEPADLVTGADGAWTLTVPTTVGPAAAVACAFDNDDQPAQLDLVKKVGPFNPSNWTLTATPTPAGVNPVLSWDDQGGANHALQGEAQNVAPGVVYTLDETAHANVPGIDLYVNGTAWTCSAADDQTTLHTVGVGGPAPAGASVFDPVAGTVAVALGDHVSCTITNATAFVTLTKTVNNTHGGTANPSQFDLALTDPMTGVVVTQHVKSNGQTDPFQLRPGTAYKVTEQPNPAPPSGTAAGYKLELTGCTGRGVTIDATANTITVDPAEANAANAIECAIVNNDIAPTLILAKTWPGGPDGATVDLKASPPPNSSSGADAVIVHVTMENGRGVAENPLDVVAGVDYDLSELVTSATPNTPVGWSCTVTDANGAQVPLASPNDRITPAVGQQITCTAINVSARVQFAKTVANSHDGQAKPDSWFISLEPVDAHNAPTGEPAIKIGVPAQTAPHTTPVGVVKPGQRYRVVEDAVTNSATGYTGREVTCSMTWNGVTWPMNTTHDAMYIDIPKPDNAAFAQIFDNLISCAITNDDPAVPLVTLGKNWPGGDLGLPPTNQLSTELTITAVEPAPAGPLVDPTTGDPVVNPPAPTLVDDGFTTTPAENLTPGAPTHRLTLGQTYTLTEKTPDGVPYAARGWTCVDAEGNTLPTTGTPGPGTGSVYDPVSNRLIVGVGTGIKCVALNLTADLSLVKLVSGGSAQPTDWKLTLTPTGPTPPAGSGAVLPQTTAPGGSVVQVMPGATYTVTETPVGEAPAGYTMGQLTCVPGAGVTVSGDTLTVKDDVSGSIGACWVTNTYVPVIDARVEITLIKSVRSGPTEQKDWEITLTPAGGAGQTVPGTGGTIQVQPDVAYTVTERTVAGVSSEGYSAMGQLSCSLPGVVTTSGGDTVIKVPGAAVPAGQTTSIICTLTNTYLGPDDSSQVSLAKVVDGGPTVRDDWVITLTPADGGAVKTVTGSGTVTLKKDVRYTVTERTVNGAPSAGYAPMGDLACAAPAVVTKSATATTVMVPGAGVPAGSAPPPIACSLTNTYQTPPTTTPPPTTAPPTTAPPPTTPPTTPPGKGKPAPGALSTTGATASQNQAVGGTWLVGMGLIAIGVGLLRGGRRQTDS